MTYSNIPTASVETLAAAADFVNMNKSTFRKAFNKCGRNGEFNGYLLSEREGEICIYAPEETATERTQTDMTPYQDHNMVYHPTRASLADAVGCSVGRIGELIKAARLNGGSIAKTVKGHQLWVSSTLEDDLRADAKLLRAERTSTTAEDRVARLEKRFKTTATKYLTLATTLEDLTTEINELRGRQDDMATLMSGI